MLKKYIIIALSIAIVLLSVVVLSQKDNAYTSFTAIECSAINYEVNSELGYLTLDFGGQKESRITKVLKVEDKDVQSQIMQVDLTDIIGANLIVSLPNKVIKSYNLDPEKVDINFLFTTNTFDDYFTVVGISLN